MRLPRPNLGRVSLVAVVVGALLCVGAAVGVAAARKDVTISVDGARRHVATYALTVGQALRQAGVRPGSHDRVTPARGAGLRSGATIAVTSARPLLVTAADGSSRRVWTTAPSAYRAALEQPAGASVPLAGRGTARLPLTVRARRLRVVHDGGQGQLQARARADARASLQAAGIQVGPLDRVALRHEGGGAVLVVNRVSRQLQTADAVTAHPVREVPDPTLALGTRQVQTPGSDGVVRTTTFVQTVDGQVVHRAVTGSQQLAALAEEVVRVGTKPAPQPQTHPVAGDAASGGSRGDDDAPAASPPGDDVWAALAQCESGGNPSSVSGNGRYHGLYQFSVSTWRSVGGQGLPSQASPAEQTKRAKILQQRSGWGQWPACSRKIGVR